MAAPMLDTYREVVTPEGVLLQLPVAGPLPRAMAWLVDLGVRIAVLVLMAIPLAVLDEFGSGLNLVLMFLVYWVYPIVCEALWGRTLGKRALGLRVLSRDGAPVGWMAAITRNLLRTVDMLPFGYALGLVSSLFDPHGRRLGDLVAGTVVVHAPVLYLPPPPTIDSVLAPPQPLRPEEQAALMAFAERAPRLRIGRLGITQRTHRDRNIGTAITLRASSSEGRRCRNASGNPTTHVQPLMPTESTRLAAQHVDRTDPVTTVQCRTAAGAAESRGPPVGFPAGDHPAGGVAAMATHRDAVREGLQAAPVIEVPARHGRRTPMPARPTPHRHQT